MTESSGRVFKTALNFFVVWRAREWWPAARISAVYFRLWSASPRNSIRALRYVLFSAQVNRDANKQFGPLAQWLEQRTHNPFYPLSTCFGPRAFLPYTS